MAGASAAAKQGKLAALSARLVMQPGCSARTAKAWVGLQLVDDRDEIIKPDDPFELETGAVVARPDDIGLDPAHHRQADNDTVAAVELPGIVDHEAMRRKVANVQMHVAVHKMLDDGRNVDRVARSAPQIGYTQISSASHALPSFPRSEPEEAVCMRKADNW
jgi:hypothetical protein